MLAVDLAGRTVPYPATYKLQNGLLQQFFGMPFVPCSTALVVKHGFPLAFATKTFTHNKCQSDFSHTQRDLKSTRSVRASPVVSSSHPGVSRAEPSWATWSAAAHSARPPLPRTQRHASAAVHSAPLQPRAQGQVLGRIKAESERYGVTVALSNDSMHHVA